MEEVKGYAGCYAGFLHQSIKNGGWRMKFKIIYDSDVCENDVYETEDIEDALNEIRVFAENLEQDDYDTAIVTLKAEW